MFHPSADVFDPDMARLRITLTYLQRHGRLVDLANPRRFTELVQHRKLYDRSPGQHPLLDKCEVKSRVRSVLGDEWTIPTLWSDTALPLSPDLAGPVIIKARHGCNQNAVLRTAPGADAWSELGRKTRRWLSRPYGLWLDEWAYRAVPRGLIAEPLLGEGPTLPLDYKIYVFGGEATHVQVHLGRGMRHRWILHDRNWRKLVHCDEAVAPPSALNEMLAAAEALAAGTQFLRIDFYQIGGQPKFGEFCLYPGSGLDRFAADWIDFELGSLWRDASRGAMPASSQSSCPKIRAFRTNPNSPSPDQDCPSG